MAQWNQSEKALHTKVVYYGPALSGKTTNLQQVHRLTDPRGENRVISLNTASDRTLFFDLLPLDLGRISGHSVKVQLYTVPGQVRYDATRRIVLAGADAVVFIADSQRGKEAENVTAWRNLRANLKVNGLDAAGVPVIVQFNKQDLSGCQGHEEIRASLGGGVEGIPASAIRGDGVIETFRAALVAMLQRLSTLSGRKRKEELDEVEQQVHQALSRFIADAPARGGLSEGAPPEASETSTTIHFGDDDESEDLLTRSLEANLGIAQQFVEMRDLKVRLQRRLGELEGLQTLTRELSRRHDAGAIMSDLVDAAVSIPISRGASLLMRDEVGSPLVTVLLRDLDSDPLTRGGAVSDVADGILDGEGPRLFDDLSDVTGGAHPDSVSTAVAVPLTPSLHAPCLLILYGEEPFTADDVRYLGLLGSHAAICLDNAAMTDHLTSYSERLESEVRARTLDLERANADLRELDRMKDRFLSSVSHEMKTPLTGIISSTELLATMTPEDDERKEFMVMVVEEGRRLSALVDKILRVQALGRMETVGGTSEVSPGEVIERAMHDLELEATSRGIVIERLVDPELPAIIGDGESLLLAVREILHNAVKFSPVGSRVRIEASEQWRPSEGSRAVASGRRKGSQDPPGARGKSGESWLVISIRDQGPGIAPEEQTRVFERFEQLGDLLTAKPSGLGLGLSFAREVARRHDGDLQVESTIGEGCTFHFLLPLRGRKQATPKLAALAVTP